MTGGGYGIPLICPDCPPNQAFRALKTPRGPVPKCPDHGVLCVPVDPERRKTWAARRR